MRGSGPSSGLSPLARGNLGCVSGGPVLAGPIPARAGQPGLPLVRMALAGAYPRSRGATLILTPLAVAFQGLSPLARGNLLLLYRACRREGPIPARAGQPAEPECTGGALWAYPRSRGATNTLLKTKCPRVGLSPLARGNLRYCLGRMTYIGPIPARAGQPFQHHGDDAVHRAYPRSRGATEKRDRSLQPSRGLSPLARGNRQLCGPRVCRVGPIPARAGQPFSA